MNLRVQKLDKRMNGHDRFTHRVIFVGRDVVRYQTALTKARNYLWAAFGPSGELEIARPPFFAETPLYAWLNDDKNAAIYLRDEALTQFLLKMESF